MPIPSPKSGENREDFIKRVIPEIYKNSSSIDDSKTPKGKSKQAYAIAMSSYNSWADKRRKASVEEGDIAEYIYLTKIVYESCMMCFIGKHNDIPDDAFDPEQLKMGIEIEKEHTNDPDKAKSIAKDHLSEIKNYYTLLKKMEDNAKQKTGE